MKNILKKLALKHLGLQEAASYISDECITIRVGECDSHCDGVTAISIALSEVTNAMVSGINDNLESSSMDVYKQIAKARSLPLGSKQKATTEKVTIVIQYETKFKD